MDLDLMTTPGARGGEHEIYDPANAWPLASGHVYVDTRRIVGGLYQIGYDPANEGYWMRFMKWDEVGWNDWVNLSPVVIPERK